MVPVFVSCNSRCRRPISEGIFLLFPSLKTLDSDLLSDYDLLKINPNGFPKQNYASSVVVITKRHRRHKQSACHSILRTPSLCLQRTCFKFKMMVDPFAPILVAALTCAVRHGKQSEQAPTDQRVYKQSIYCGRYYF